MKNGVPPDDPNDYLPCVPNLLAHLRQWDDAAFMRAALVDLVRNNGLTPEVCRHLCSGSNMDPEAEELTPILEFMLTQIEQELHPPVPDTQEVELISTGDDESTWAAQRHSLNEGIRWQADSPSPDRPRLLAPGRCPVAGFWFTPSKPGNRRYFNVEDIMPSLNEDHGATIWQWDRSQDPPKL